MLIFFFFSSRRRHTRWPRDWSSDVCSSDLCDCLDCDRMDLRVVSSAERAEKLAASAIGGYALIGHPHALRQFPGLPEHIDRHSAPRIPVAADAQPFRPEQLEQFLADRDRAVFVESAMITVAVEIEFERF